MAILTNPILDSNKSLCQSCVKVFNVCKIDLKYEHVTECIMYRKGKERSNLYCKIMNIIDVRYWNCDCFYCAPYGKVISADCRKHD
jgi:hypothetical protein